MTSKELEQFYALNEKAEALRIKYPKDYHTNPEFIDTVDKRSKLIYKGVRYEN